MPEHLADGIARENHVAKMAPPAACRLDIDGDPGHRLVTWQKMGQLGELVLTPAARQPRIRKIVGDFLQAKDIKICDRPRLPDDPRGIDPPVDAATPLRIPGNELHLIPALMKDCTNCLWYSKNATSSGAVVSKVAAVIIDQSMPWSVAEKTCRPTVSGRDSTEFVMISGHRKLFQ